MRKLRKLTPANLAVLVPAGVTVAAVRLSLWLLPSRVLLRHVARRVANAPAAAPLSPAVRRLAWAVGVVSRPIPGATCLTQALALQLLLARRGYSSVLRVGVAQDPREGFAAHAWIDVGGEVLIGGRGTHRFTELPDLATRL